MAAAFASSSFSASDYLQYRPTYPPWVYELIARYHATGKIEAETLLAAQEGRAVTPAQALPGVKWERALDLGCGPGTASVALTPFFDSVMGIDPSATMISKAIQDPSDASLPPALQAQPLQHGSRAATLTGCPRSTLGKVTYLEDSALTLANYLSKFGVSGSGPVPPEAQVDLVVAFESVHWLTPYKQLWETLDRVVRPGGSVVFVAYTELYLPDFPHLTPLIDQLIYGQLPPSAEDGVGPLWQQGRYILDAGLIDVPAPWIPVKSPAHGEWNHASFQRRRFSDAPGTHFDTRWPPLVEPAVAHEGDAGGAPIASSEIKAASTLKMTQRFTWDHLEKFFNTYSSIFLYRTKHPEDLKNGGGMTHRFIRRMQDSMLATLKSHDPTATLPTEFTVQWPLHVLAAKKTA